MCRKAIIAAAVCLAMTIPAVAAVNPKPFVVPELSNWDGGEGQTSLSGRIIVADAKLKAVAQALKADYQEMFGRTLTVGKGKAKDGDIVLALKKDGRLGAEGYTLAIGRQVRISAATATGAFWATRTLLQMTEQSADLTLARGTATDVPRYGLRGLMIDCGRKYIPLHYLRQLVKVMAYYKLNTLQIHLNDNGFKQYFNNDWAATQAAFRLECDTYPGLTAKDGSYTKKEFVDFQLFADANCVEIIPEIDAPAHALAFTQYRPSLGSSDYGMDHLDLFNPETYTFMDTLYDEYLGGKQPVFRGKRMHIGTDEYSNARKDVVEKFRAFTDHYIRLVERYGKQAMVWGALTHAAGETAVKSENVVMNCWYNGYADPKEMQKQGYQLVSIPDGMVYIVPAAGYYYDYLDCKMLYERWTPAVIGNQTFAEADPSVLGGMFAVWNDHVGNGITVKDIHHRIMPALQTMATKCWDGANTTLSFADFDRKRQLLSEGPGVNELARAGKPGETVMEMATVAANTQTEMEEIGYNYGVSFTIDGQQEEKATVLFRSSNATVYLADPKQGKIGFEREGYLNTFNYRIAANERHNLRIEGDNRATRLYVDGKLREELGPLPLYVMTDTDRVHYQTGGIYEPTVYNPSAKMFYQRTLVFPLRHTGTFKSTITNLKVEVAP